MVTEMGGSSGLAYSLVVEARSYSKCQSSTGRVRPVPVIPANAGVQAAARKRGSWNDPKQTVSRVNCPQNSSRYSVDRKTGLLYTDNDKQTAVT